MTKELHPCNECWSDALHLVGHEDCESRYDDERIGCSNKECKRYLFGNWENIEAEIHYDDDFEYERLALEGKWNAANPISHAGKMLVEQYAVQWDYNSELVETYCLECATTTYMNYGNEESLVWKHEHSPTCALITKARLPLKTKEIT